MPSKRRHFCPYPGCEVAVSRSKLGCPVHWRILPQHLKSAIYANYKPGQNILTASPAYLDALQTVLDYWHEDALYGSESKSESLRRSGATRIGEGEVDAL